MVSIPQHLWLDARLAWPRAENRIALTLPKAWRKRLKLEQGTEFDAFDSSGYAERKEKEEQGIDAAYEAKKKRGWELKSKAVMGEVRSMSFPRMRMPRTSSRFHFMSS